ncbi:MAG: DUF3330 domain-containing protein [Gammaproteobacteria bacterium]|nr:DUF3330 domain-containing protein [Gammaproteobacteria bacterium]NNJ93371.1 DUF3330 domain-containing protein [Halobacteria archaeon]
MSAVVKPIDSGSVACDVCLKEIPHSEAGIVEAEDYVMYFCGLDCYRQWREAQDNTAG